MFRASFTLDETKKGLGLLGDLPGTWIGTGFNLIARPDHQNNKPFFLQLNSTTEVLEFRAVGGDIPNRGSQQGDAILQGIHYLQRVSDCTTFSALHLEPGLWIRVPPTDVPKAAESYVRMATIPHGDSVLAQTSAAFTVPGGPKIDPVDSFPFTGAIPGLNGQSATQETNPVYLAPYLQPVLGKNCLPAGLPPDADLVKDPTHVLRAAIAGQKFSSTSMLAISTQPVGGLVNIPFVVANADAAQLDAIFWIEQVQAQNGKPEFLQLQYVQRVILTFLGIQWPHISVATLVKQ